MEQCYCVFFFFFKDLVEATAMLLCRLHGLCNYVAYRETNRNKKKRPQPTADILILSQLFSYIGHVNFEF